MKYLKRFNEEKSDIKSIIKNLLLSGKEGSREFKKLVSNHSTSHERYSPPKKLEEQIPGLKVSQNYNIPFDITREELEDVTDILMEDEESTKFVFNKLLDANPELSRFKNLPFKGDEGIFLYPTGGVIGGVCSSINPDDIQDYIDNGTEALTGFDLQSPYTFKRASGDQKEYDRLYNKLQESDIEQYYFASPQTMKLALSKIQ